MNGKKEQPEGCSWSLVGAQRCTQQLMNRHHGLESSANRQFKSMMTVHGLVAH